MKIDPKHIGVGQYQHDVNQKELEKVLDDTVEDAVNNVGVNINRASVSLLKHVAGVNKTIAKNIIDYREQNGKFGSRKEIKKVKGLGAKAFEQCAGFLRIDDGDNILDNTGVHPESYKAVQNLLKSMGLTTADLEADKLAETVTRLNALDVKATAAMLEIGEPTLRDIIKELKKPGRDPRDSAPKPHLKSDVLSIEDLKPDMELVGTVRNVIDFGAFVDIGVHQDGLVHISQISDPPLYLPVHRMLYPSATWSPSRCCLWMWNANVSGSPCSFNKALRKTCHIRGNVVNYTELKIKRLVPLFAGPGPDVKR